jgi:hypothetical protein
MTRAYLNLADGVRAVPQAAPATHEPSLFHVSALRVGVRIAERVLPFIAAAFLGFALAVQL